MIKRFVLKYIRNHMSHESGHTRSEIFQAINDGCDSAFNEDNTQTRLSWMVGEIVRNDREFTGWLEKNHQVTGWVAGAIYNEISEYVSEYNRIRAEQRNYAAKQLIRNRK